MKKIFFLLATCLAFLGPLTCIQATVTQFQDTSHEMVVTDLLLNPYHLIILDEMDDPVEDNFRYYIGDCEREVGEDNYNMTLYEQRAFAMLPNNNKQHTHKGKKLNAVHVSYKGINTKGLSKRLK